MIGLILLRTHGVSTHVDYMRFQGRAVSQAGTEPAALFNQKYPESSTGKAGRFCSQLIREDCPTRARSYDGNTDFLFAHWLSVKYISLSSFRIHIKPC